MANWFGRIFGFGSKKITKNLQQQVQNTKTTQKVLSEVKATVGNEVAQATKSSGPSIGSQLDYGKWYYGVDTKAQPVVRRFPGGIEKRYPCKDGGELVLKYVSRADNSSSLSVVKTGNPIDINKGDWYRGFYSDTAVKHYEDRFGNNVRTTIKKKGGRKQILSSQHGRPTEEVHVPLKRWERTTGGFSSNTKVENDIISSNPKDFDRFID
jgi:hypothetical protein